MKHIYLLQALALTFCATSNSTISAQAPAVAEESASTLEPLHDAADKTDIYAIPLDTSEMEEEADQLLKKESE